MAKKVLGAAKSVLTTANTIDKGGGLSSLVVPVKASPLGAGVILTGMTALSIGKEGASLHNQASMGKVTWEGTAARMTSNYERNGALRMTSGTTAAIRRQAMSGNTQMAYEMVEQTMRGPDIGGAIETYGVTPKFVSAIYGMGG